MANAKCGNCDNDADAYCSSCAADIMTKLDFVQNADKG